MFFVGGAPLQAAAGSQMLIYKPCEINVSRSGSRHFKTYPEIVLEVFFFSEKAP